MKFLFIGDIVGKAGRKSVEKHVRQIKMELSLDCVIANAENASAGFGLGYNAYKELRESQIDYMTLGNHSWDQRDIFDWIENEIHVIRPANYPAGTPGVGYRIYTTMQEQKIMIINVLGVVFMQSLDCPFRCVDNILKKYELGRNVDAIVVDMHAEATAEKMAMGHFLDGRVSLVVGTHTHVPTADQRIFQGGTAYMTDVGMTGDYDSVIGMDKKEPIKRAVNKISRERLSAAQAEATLCAVFVETDETTGLAKKISPLRRGGCLQHNDI